MLGNLDHAIGAALVLIGVFWASWGAVAAAVSATVPTAPREPTSLCPKCRSITWTGGLCPRCEDAAL